MKKTVRAVADYIPGEADELAFKEGDVFEIEYFEDEDWWDGTLDGRQGLVPRNYVEILEGVKITNHNKTVSPSNHSSVPIEGLFKENFWESDLDPLHPAKKLGEGFNILVQRLIDGKQTYKQLNSFFEKRAQIEETYARSLLALSKSHLGRNEMGTLRTAIENLKNEAAAVGESHRHFSRQLLSDIARPLMSVKNEQKKVRKEAVHELLRLRNMIDTESKRAISSRKKYSTKVKEYSNTNMSLGAAQNSGTSNEQELTKLQDRLDKALAAVQEARDKYQHSVDAVQTAQKQYVCKVEISADAFQEVDLERIRFVTEQLSEFSKLQSTLATSDDASAKRLTQPFGQISPEEDILTFTMTRKLTSERPPLYKFKDVENAP